MINIGNNIRITIIGCDRGVARVGIDAPKDIPVHRKEIYDKIVEMNKNAAKTNAEDLRVAMEQTFIRKTEK